MPPPLPSKLIFPTHEFSPRRGGIATYVEETARAASRSGAAVAVWAGGPVHQNELSFDFEYQPIGNRGSLDWPCLWKTARFLRSRRREVERATLCLAEPGPIFASLYPALFPIPQPRRLALVLHGSEILRIAAFPHRRIGFRRLLSKTAIIGVVSEFTRSLINRHFPGHGERVVLVPGALRSDFRIPRSRKRSADDPEIRVLTVARVHPRKGMHLVIEALSRLPTSQRRNLIYQIVGPPSRPAYANRLKQLAAQLGVRMDLRHEDEDLPQIYADADIFAMTSENTPMSVESFGLVYLEAGAHGLPVVAHRTGGVGEAVRHGDSGLLVAPEDGDALTRAFAKLLETPALRRQLGEGGRRRVAELSWVDNVRKLFPSETREHANSFRFQ